ncbi:MAG: leucine-rich repeat domain-containing protein, partial [Prevotella sp.]|nr:leucine-rich repeat domain-containing protein [Prevotella sp.]
GTSPNYTLTISGTGAMQDANWGEMPWDSYKDGITTVIIEDGVTSIGKGSFKNHEKLASITIANSVTTIGGQAFELCYGLTEFTVPDGVTNIDGGAFNQCLNMETFNIGTGLATIDNSGVFLECAKLATFTVAAGNTAFKAEDGVLLTYDGTELVAYPAAKTATTYTIPDDVTTIWDYAFYQCTKLTEVTFPASATIIGYSAFDFCTALATVTFEAGSQLATIDDYAFDSCFSLSSITIPASVTSIGEWAFYDCSALVTVTMLPATPPFLGSDALVIGGSNTNKKFYFHGTAYGTDTYSDWNNMYNNTGSFSSWTTTVIGTLTLSEGTTKSTAADMTYDNTEYYYQGTTVTLGHGDAPEGKVFAGYTVKDANDNDVTVTENEGVYTFDMPAGDVTATVNWREIIPYIDADGTTKCCTDYTVLTGEESELDGGWYYVTGTVDYCGSIQINDHVNIILCDGATMNIGTPDNRINDDYGIVDSHDDCSLTIYGQSGQTGRLNVYNDASDKAAVDLWCYNQYGGNVNIDANYAALSLHKDSEFNLNLKRGTLTVTAANGKDAIKCNTVVYGVLMEGGTLAATSIGGTAINGRVNFSGGTLTANGGDSGCGISGYVALSMRSAFDSFTASSFNSDVSIAYGKSVSDGTKIYTNSNQSEIKSLKNVTLTLPTCSLIANEDPAHAGEYWSTFYHPTAGYQVDASTTTAYIATLNSEETALTLTEVEGGFIPAGHAVILKSTTSSYDIDRAETGDAFDFTTNSLLGGGKVNPTYDVYTLAAKDGVVGFYKFTGTSLNPYKAHLECAPADSRDYYGLEEGETTSLFEMRNEKGEMRNGNEGMINDAWYDLQGRRIANGQKPTAKGLYIHNGKTIVITP